MLEGSAIGEKMGFKSGHSAGLLGMPNRGAE